MTIEGETAPDSFNFEGESKQRYWLRFALMLGIAVIVATFGLYRDSGAVVIAAMLIAPLMTPILGVATSLVIGQTGRLVYLLFAIAIASFGTMFLSFAIMYLADVPLGIAIPGEVMARTDPGLEELFIALAAGTAGAYVQMRKEEISLLPGVAIGVSLVPPLSAAGIFYYFNQPNYAWDATFLYLTNLAAIVFSACIVFLVLGVRPPAREAGSFAKVGLGTISTFAVVIVIAYHLTEVTVQRFQETRAEEKVVSAVLNWSRDIPVEIVYVDVKPNLESPTVEVWMIFEVPFHLTEEVRAARDKLPSDLSREDLFRSIAVALRSEAKIALRSQIRYSGQFSAPEGAYLGQPVRRAYSR